MSMSFARIFHAIAFAAAIGSAAAQTAGSADLLPTDPKAAFAGEYGSALVRQLSGSLERAADRQCRAARTIDFEAAARSIFVAHASRLQQSYPETTGLQTIERTIVASGRSADLARFREILGRPTMQEYLKHQAIPAATRLAEDTGEMFRRYVIARKLPLKVELGWVADGNQEMMDLWERLTETPDHVAANAHDDLQELIAFVEPYKTQIEAANKALAELQRDKWKIFEGVEMRLAELCIPAPR